MCQPSSPPVSFASEAIKLPVVTDLDIGLEDGARGASRVCTAGARINPAPGTTECCAINGRRYRTRPACVPSRGAPTACRLSGGPDMAELEMAQHGHDLSRE